MDVDLKALQKLREPFPAAQVGKLPKGGIFLDFVGHGWLTQRFLDADPLWDWEPFALDANGLPLLDEHGGLWLRLTIAGKSRIGYGDAGGKKGPNAIKEAIGDGLRNAGMRFGAALDLWCKGDPDAPAPPPPPTPMDEALNLLDDTVATLGLKRADVATKFFEEHQKPPRGTDAETVREFARALDKADTTKTARQV
jgi:hypothetical protein